MSESPDSLLYRPAAIRAKAISPHGEVVLATPISMSVVCWIAVGLAIAVIVFSFGASYTKKARLLGLVEPTEGVIRILAPEGGTVVAKRVREGQEVRAGDELFVVSTDRQFRDGATSALSPASIGESVDTQLRRKLSSILEERRQVTSLSREQEVALRKRIASLTAERETLAAEVKTQERRTSLASEALDQHRELRKSGYVSDAALKQREDQYLDQTARLQALQRSQAMHQRDLDNAAQDLQDAPRRQHAQAASLDREEFSVRRELGENAARKAIVITAPTDGTVTAVMGEVGKMTGSAALAVLVPTAAVYQAQLYAPSQSIGFVQPGQQVLLRYLAYPYQKYGQYRGEVLHVSRTPLASSELPQGFGSANSEPLYRITVRLEAQAIRAGGANHPLVAGMRAEADVLQDRRRIVEWAFEPLLGFIERVN